MSKTTIAMIKHTQSLVFATAILSAPRIAAAADYYVALDGSDTANGSASTPWATFAHAFATMSGGDALIIKDGTYHQSLTDMPGGSASKYTVVKAEHDFKVVIAGAGDGSLWINSNYLQIEGLKFDGESVRQPAMIAGYHHIKILRTAFYGAPCTDNTTVVSAGPSSHDLLFEDCWAFGCGRYKFTVYQSQRVIFRRCVSRHDYHKAADDQCATFTTYDAVDTLYQNVIALDSGQDPAQYGNDYAGIWFENNDRVDNTVTVQGSIFLNLDTFVFNDPKVYAAHNIQNVVAWDCQSGGHFWNVYDDWQGAHQPSVGISHVTMGKIRGVRQDATPAGGVGFTGESGYSNFPIKARDSLLYQCNSYGIGTDVDSDYNNFFGNASDYMQGGKGAGAHDTHVDPKLKYIVQIEDGSPLKKAASDGGDVGANVLYRYGVSGTLWGEPGYDQLTSDPLWPYPYEAAIKADMSAWTGPHDGKRGFCAPGNGLYGGPITLSSYIWEYLGNACPDDKCKGSAGTGGTTGTGGSPNTATSASGGNTGGTIAIGGTRNSGGTTNATSSTRVNGNSGGASAAGGAKISGGATNATSVRVTGGTTSAGNIGGANTLGGIGGIPNSNSSQATGSKPAANGGAGGQNATATAQGGGTLDTVGGNAAIESSVIGTSQASNGKGSDSGCGCAIPGKQRSRISERFLLCVACGVGLLRRCRKTPAVR